VHGAQLGNWQKDKINQIVRNSFASDLPAKSIIITLRFPEIWSKHGASKCDYDFGNTL